MRKQPMNDLVREMRYLDEHEKAVRGEIGTLTKIERLFTNTDFKALLEDLDGSSIEARDNLVIPQVKEQALSVLLGIARFKEHITCVPQRKNALEQALLDIEEKRFELSQEIQGN